MWAERKTPLIKHLDDMGQNVHQEPHYVSSGLSHYFYYISLLNVALNSSSSRENKGQLKAPALEQESLSLQLSDVTSMPARVPGSLFNLYHRTAEEHPAARPAYISEAPLSHRTPAPADICSVSTQLPQQTHSFPFFPPHYWCRHYCT